MKQSNVSQESAASVKMKYISSTTDYVKVPERK